jgi:hypothetical protein
VTKEEKYPAAKRQIHFLFDARPIFLMHQLRQGRQKFPLKVTKSAKISDTVGLRARSPQEGITSVAYLAHLDSDTKNRHYAP